MYIVFYKKKNKQYEEYLDIENSLKDKIRYNYLISLERYKHIQDLQIEKTEF